MIDSSLTFRGFLNFLRDKRSHEKTMKVRFLESVISSFERRIPSQDIISLSEIGKYEDLLQWVYALLFPPIEDERQKLWALSTPMKPVIFYGTDAFYNLLKDPDTGELRISLIDKDRESNKKINLEMIYSFILKRLYNFDYAPGTQVVHSTFDPVTGVPKFYKLDIDTRFVEILPRKGCFPPMTPAIRTRLHEAASIEFLKENFPLDLFRFEGFSAIGFTDITWEYAIENIKNTILDRTVCEMDASSDKVIHSLKALAGDNAVEFSLLPFLKVNDKVVFSGDTWYHSILTGPIRQYRDAESAFLSMTAKYLEDPRLVLFETVSESDESRYPFLKILRKSGINSFALLPINHNNRLAGVLEVYSGTAGILDHAMLSRLDLAVPLLAQLLQRSIDEFDAELKAIIKENYTAVQPSVEWKFYETAWHFLRDNYWKGDHSGLEPIRFKNVYPLYGALDIRNSTIERNKALKSDLQMQFGILTETLTALQEDLRGAGLRGAGLPGAGPGVAGLNDEGLQVDNGVRVDDLLASSQQWMARLSGTLTTAGEMELNEFLTKEVGSFFERLRTEMPGPGALTGGYLEAADESSGIAYQNRRELEASIQLINSTINDKLESSIVELQQSYPFYFEKFRTDGIEYDIYIGESITPDKHFDTVCLQELRIWQLRSMAEIARLTYGLLGKMPDPLFTTQLIFVHSSPIDISFRQDERKFDVEGSYNIRYEVVKKRIDKVRLSGRDERLTQPGKIAVVYFSEREAEEYIGYIRRLQEEGVLEDDLELLDLEELQGVTGLKACRVGVKYT